MIRILIFFGRISDVVKCIFKLINCIDIMFECLCEEKCKVFVIFMVVLDLSFEESLERFNIFVVFGIDLIEIGYLFLDFIFDGVMI